MTGYTGSYWNPANPVNLIVNRVNFDGSTTRINFKSSAPTTKFTSIEARTYNITASGATETYNLNVVNKDILGIYVKYTAEEKDPELDADVYGVVYIDEKFDPEIHAKDIEIWGILANGEPLLIAKGDKLEPKDVNVNYPAIDLQYSLETQNIGKNRVIVYLNKNLVCQYTVECRERKVEDVEVFLYIPEDFKPENPDDEYVPEYTVGSLFNSKTIEKINVKYEGIEGYVEIKVSEVEFIGDTIYYGTNEVRVAYKNYTTDAIVVTGVCNDSTHMGGEATCKTLAVCERCKQQYGEYGAHVGGVATCNKLAECTECGEEYGSFGAHDYTATVIVPTCDKDGYTVYTCSVCSDSYKDDVVDARGHRGGVATCIARAVCTICEQSYGALVPHVYSTTTYSPECTKAGYTEYYCSICDHRYKENYVSALGHSGGIPNADGTAKCEKCGEDYNVQNSGAGSHKFVTTVVAPTCSASGYTEYKCIDCNYSYKDNYVSAIAHSGGTATCLSGAICSICGEVYGDRGAHKYISTVVNATCVDNGYTLYSCSVCSTSYQYGDTPAVGHVGGKADCVDPATCSRCGDYYGDVVEHRYVTSVVAPTCTADGYTDHTCSVCGNSYQDTVVRAFGHDYPDVSCQDTKCRNNCGTQKGFQNSFGGFGAMMLNIILVPLGFIFKRRFF